jgi:hypothetical protein
MAPFDHVKADAPRVLLTVSEYEPYYFQWPSIALAASLLKRTRRMPRFLTLPDHNHVSPALQIGGETDTLGDTLLEFISESRRLAP